jgi:hypothetical protein
MHIDKRIKLFINLKTLDKQMHMDRKSMHVSNKMSVRVYLDDVVWKSIYYYYLR